MDMKLSCKVSCMFLVVVLVMSVFSGISITEVRASENEELVLIRDFEGRLSEEELQSRGELVDSYGSFFLLKTAERDLELLSEEYNVDRLDHRNELNVKGHAFDSSEGYPDFGSEFTLEGYEPGTEGLYVIDMIGPVNPEWQEELNEMDVELINYVPNYAFEARMTPEQAEEVEEKFFVDWVGIYQPGFKLKETLEPGMVNIRLTQGVSREVKRSIGSMVDVISVADLATYGVQIRAEVRDEAVFTELARMPDVYHISNYAEPELRDEMATQIVGGGLWNFDPDDDPYNPWRGHDNEFDYGSHANHLGWSGDGVTISIADTGINPDHLDFQDRVIGGYVWGAADWEDGHGHGSHVAGSAAGNTYEGTGFTVDQFEVIENLGPYYAAQGPAYESELYSVKIFDDAGGWVGPQDSFEIAEAAAQNSDTYIHSNSWGTTIDLGDYLESSEAFDAASRDSNRDTEENEPMLIVVAAGNEGPGESTVGAPATGKNVIGVGSTENFMPEPDFIYADNPDNVAESSSRGWTADNRIKPDVMAPGEGVISTGDEGTDSYLGMGGTSMACPAVSGAASLVVEWYESTYGYTPSPAMVRALLINTASPLDEDQGNTGSIPNRDEGWGMVNLPGLMDSEVGFFFEDQQVLLQTGEMEEYTVAPEDTSEPLKISLTWTDKEGQAGDTYVLNNDLNLEIEAPNGDVYRGNAFQDGWSQPNTDTMADFDTSGDGWDDVNNIENVYIPPDDLEDGEYTVRVIGEDIPADANNDGEPNQDYALVVYNEEGVSPPQVSIESPTEDDYWQYGEDEEIIWNTEEGTGTITDIDLEYSIDGGSSWDIIAEGVDDTGSYTWTVPEEPTDQATVRVTVRDDEEFETTDTSGEFIITKLYAPSDPSPEDGAENLDTEVDLSVLVEHGGFGDGINEGLLHKSEFQGDLERYEDPELMGSEANWRWLYNADWRDIPAASMYSEVPEWYGAIRLDLSDEIGEEITHVSHMGSPEAGPARAYVAEDDGGAPGEWLASSEEKIPEIPPAFTEFELDEPVEITEPGDYWIVVEVSDPMDENIVVFAVYEDFVEDGAWMASEQPHEPGAWTELIDQGIDYSWALEARIPRDIYFTVDILNYDRIVDAGEDVLVEYEVTNAGEVEDTQDIEFYVDDNLIDTEEVTLGGGDVHEGVFRWESTEIGEYEIRVASDDDEEMVTVNVEDPSDFQVDITEYKDEVVEGEEVSVNYTVHNEGEAASTQDIEFRVDGDVEDSQSMTLDIDEEDQGEFTWTAGEPGNYVLQVASYDDEDEVTVSVEMSLEVTFYDASDDSVIGVHNVASGERAGVTWEDLDYETSYEWYAEVSDGVLTETSPTWSFTTEPDAHFEVEIEDYAEEMVAGEDFVVEYSVTNIGESTDVQDIGFYVNGVVEKTEELELAGGADHDGEFTWEVENAGQYSFMISSRDEQTEERWFTALVPPHFEVEIEEYPEEIVAGDEVVIDYSVENTGEAEGVQTIEFKVDGVVEDSEDVTLTGDDIHEEQFTWSTDESGEYTLEVSSEDTEYEITVTVLDPPYFEVEIVEYDDEVVEGDPVQVEYTVTNTGDIEGTQDIEFIVDGAVDDHVEIELSGGESYEGSFIWQTNEAGDYDLEVSSEDTEEDASVTVLKDAHFEVEIIGYNEEVTEGEDVVVEYEVTNTGDVEGTKTVSFTVDGEEKDSTEITLDGGDYHQGEFTWQTEEGDDGNYDIRVGTEDHEDIRTEALTVQEESILESLGWLPILIIIVIVVILVLVLVLRKKGDEEEENPCGVCGDEMRFIEQYDSWYCDTCQDYRRDTPDEQAAVGTGGAVQAQTGVQQQSDRCPNCGGELKYIEEYERWYCYSCQQYK